ncbi:hypothetical protein Tco_0597584, partial [Tanacetum coccineum]
PDDLLMPDAIERLGQLEEGMQEHVVALEGSNTRLRDALGIERVRPDSLQRRLGYVEDELRQRVEEALAAQEANRNAGLIDENQSQNGDDNDNGSGGNGNHGNNNGDGNQNGGNGGARRNAPVARVCTYKDFLNCQPRNFSGTEGVVGLARWFEKMESVFRISNYPSNSQVKFATCTLLDGALTWNEIQKLENKLWNLCVKGTDIAGYTRRFQELTLLCPRMVPEENDKIERFIWGLPDNIQGNVTSSKPVRLQDAIRMANGLMDQKVRVYVARSVEKKSVTPSNLSMQRNVEYPKALHYWVNSTRSASSTTLVLTSPTVIGAISGTASAGSTQVSLTPYLTYFVI